MRAAREPGGSAPSESRASGAPGRRASAGAPGRCPIREAPAARSLPESPRSKQREKVRPRSFCFLQDERCELLEHRNLEIKAAIDQTILDALALLLVPRDHNELQPAEADDLLPFL